MNKTLHINTIALEDIAGIKKGEKMKFIGGLITTAGILAVVIGEIATKKSSLKIRAVNNEAADLIEELDNIWLAQNKK